MKRTILIVASVVALTLAAIWFWQSESPGDVFLRLFLTDLSSEAEIISYHRTADLLEHDAFFHVRLPPGEFETLLQARPYTGLESGSSEFRAFREGEYRIFRSRLPDEESLAEWDIYRFWDNQTVKAYYLIASKNRQDIFALYVRF